MRRIIIVKKKLTLSIDEDVYDKLGEIPRKVSVSEVTSWFLKMFVEEIKLGREMTDEEACEEFSKVHKTFEIALPDPFETKKIIKLKNMQYLQMSKTI